MDCKVLRVNKLLRIFVLLIIILNLSSNLIAQAIKNSLKSQSEVYSLNKEFQEKMFFQEISNNDLIFYNEKKKLYYLRFRMDKWDYENNTRVAQLIQGSEYLVVFQYTGEGEMENSVGSKKIRKPGSIIFGLYKDHRSITDRIRGL